MGETLTERRRVDEEGRKVVKSFCRRRIRRRVESLVDDVSLRISPDQLRASSRVTRMGQALFGITGRKGRVGGFVSLA